MAERDLTLPSYGARIRELARRSGVAAFFSWWTREIAAAMPAAPRAAIARRRMRPVVAFAGESATLWRPVVQDGRPVMRSAATIPLAGAAEGRAAIASLAAPGGSRHPRVAVCIAPQDILRKRIVMPAAVEENLRQVLAYDLDRHTPFKPEELYFDAVVVDRQPARNTVTVEFAAARKTTIEPALRHVAAWGAEVAAVVPAAPENVAESRLNLLPPELRTSRPLLLRWQFWVPVILLLALAVAAIAIPLWQKREYVLQLAAEADQARTRAAVSETLRAELNARVADYNFALERKYTFPGALTVVDTVSKLLPDDTWLTQLELKTMNRGKDTTRELSLRGETSNAGRLVQLFEESQVFMQAAQRGPTTKIQPGPGEIFDLGAMIRPQPMPQTVAMTVTDKPPVAPAPPPAPSATPAPAAPAAPPPAQPAGAQPPTQPAAAPPAAAPPPAKPAAAPAAAAPPAAPSSADAKAAPPAMKGKL